MNCRTLLAFVAGAALLLGASASYAMSTGSTGASAGAAGAAAGAGSNGPGARSVTPILVDDRGNGVVESSSNDGTKVLVGRRGSSNNKEARRRGYIAILMPATGVSHPSDGNDGPLTAAPPPAKPAPSVVLTLRTPTMTAMLPLTRCGLEADHMGLDAAKRAKFMDLCAAGDLSTQ
jgi:hypothetical protein